MPESEGTQSAAPATTQRAYTLRLHGPDKNDHSWREALWATHEAVNSGAKVFGDWLLTLRGGLDHGLVDLPVPKKKLHEARPPNAQEIRDRRILLALSWLSVESAPRHDELRSTFIVASGGNGGNEHISERVIAALREILRLRNLEPSAIGTWVRDCQPSLSAAIRPDAVWVNRSAMFDAALPRFGPAFNREEIWDMLDPFFAGKTAYFASAGPDDGERAEPEGAREKAKDLVQKAGGWLSRRMGTGKGADFATFSRVYVEINKWASNQKSDGGGQTATRSLMSALGEFKPATKDVDGILALISGPGYKSATRSCLESWPAKTDGPFFEKLAAAAAGDAAKCESKIGEKGQRDYADVILGEVAAACGFAYLREGGAARHGPYSVMLDHAARRASTAHTWIKRAEAQRRQFQADVDKLGAVPEVARNWLDGFCRERSSESGAPSGYRIRRRAVGGWQEIVSQWGRKSCNTPEARIAAVKEAQRDPETEKFGDAWLFEALAAPNAECVWRIGDRTDPKPLLDYVAAAEGAAKQRRFKVPAYRHPDPLLHPVFCDFGNSRPVISFSAHKAPKELVKARAALDRCRAKVAAAETRMASDKHTEKRTEAQANVERELSRLRQVEDEFKRLGNKRSLTLELCGGTNPSTHAPLFWSCKRLTADLGIRGGGEDGKIPVPVTRADRLGRAAAQAPKQFGATAAGIFELKDWNGRLQAPRAQLDVIGKLVAQNGWNSEAEKLRDRIRCTR